MSPESTQFFKDQRILVTGACGTIGSELVRQLLEEIAVGEVIGLDNNESELFFLEQRFQRHDNARFFLADVRDREKLGRKMQGIDIVFHAAAFKHVILCERSPFEAVQTNILGVQNVVNAAIDHHVQRVVFTSSDSLLPVFDRDAAMENLGDPELIENLIHKFVDEIGQDLDAIAKAVSDNKAEAAGLVAHKIKGEASFLGAEQVRVSALALEKAGRSGKTDEIKVLSAELFEAIERLRTEIK